MRGGERRLPRIPGLAASLGLALLAMPARGMIPSQPCSTPTVFPGAAVNVVVRPYRYAEGADYARGAVDGLGRAGDWLSLLVQLDAFYSLLKYESVGAIRLLDDSPDKGCPPDQVLAQLLGERGGADQQVAAGRGLVLVWGRIYEEGEDIFVQTYVRFLRRGVGEGLDLRTGDRRFAGKLPFQAVAFAPRRLTHSDLRAIEREFAAAAVVHAEPNEASAGRPLPLDLRDRLAYAAVEVKGGWIRIVSEGGGPSGWLRASLEAVRSPLREKLPELDFVEGVSGYLRYRVGEQDGAKVPQAADWAARALRSYRERAGDVAAEAPAAASSHLLAGLLSVLRSGEAAPGLLAAQRDFERAVELVPYSADARNLALMTRIDLAYEGGQPGLPPKQVADDFLQAASLEPQNRLLLDNLESFYRLLGTTGPPPGADPSSKLEKTELEDRLRFVQGLGKPDEGRGDPAQKPGE